VNSDPLPFQWLAREPELCRNVRFVDVDYKALMLTKKEIIEATPQMNDLLTTQAVPNDGYTVLNTNEYVAVGCDLRDITGLDTTIESLTKPHGCLVLCVAEVSVIYMNATAADALIEWAARLSSGKSSYSSP
jgi:tRNA wybutosine-synthesizing protein 4